MQVHLIVPARSNHRLADLAILARDAQIRCRAKGAQLLLNGEAGLAAVAA